MLVEGPENTGVDASEDELKLCQMVELSLFGNVRIDF
jgi:hypothetical protein